VQNLPQSTGNCNLIRLYVPVIENIHDLNQSLLTKINQDVDVKKKNINQDFN